MLVRRSSSLCGPWRLRMMKMPTRSTLMIALLCRFVSVEVPQIARGRQLGAKPDIGIPMRGAPLDGLRAEGPGNPHGRMGFLVGQGPRIDVAIMKMFPLVAPRTGSRPGLDDKVVRFVEHLAVVRGIGIIEELLAARSAHPAGDQSAARDQIDLGELFGHP